MNKSAVSLAALTLAALSWNQVPALRTSEPPMTLKEESLTLEYNATVGDVVVKANAECEVALDRVEVRNPHGSAIFNVRSQGGRGIALSSLKLETQESDLATLCLICPEGHYDMRAVTVDGRAVLGGAELTHELPAVPEILFPLDGDHGIAPEVTVRWALDPQADGYRVTLEQDENDGLVVNLPPGNNSFTVPAYVLAPQRRTRLEVGAIGPNGNTSAVEVLFRTR